MKKRILIVDNDEQLNRINERILITAGIVSELHFTRNGKEALEYLRTRLEKNYALPEIIVFDIDLPVMDGFQFIEAFRNLDFTGRPEIELVVFTASSSPKARQKAISMGIRHYLSKPYLLRGLNDVIYRLDIDNRYSNRKTFGMQNLIS